MNKISKYAPSFSHATDHPAAEFETLEELLEIPWVKNWAEAPNFLRYAQSEDLHSSAILMADLQHNWWVIGTLDQPVAGMPKWVPRGGPDPHHLETKVWLDDERDPLLWAPKSHGKVGWIWVKTVQEAVKLLETGLVTHVSLDHDLGTLHTGYDLACWIERKAHAGELPRLNWRLHTSNPAGEEKMRQALLAADKSWTAHDTKKKEEVPLG